LLAFLPPAGLDQGKVRYFHLPLQLDKHYFVASENILNLDRRTDCLLAEYPQEEGDPLVLLLIRYENALKAEAAQGNFLKIYMPEAREGLARMENGKWTMAGREDDLLKIVFEAPDAERAAGLLAAVHHRKNESRTEVKQ
jgi:hypothetical protein